MVTFPLADSARLLGIHPKTLHHWLKEANIPFTAHPSDARIKCLTEDHLCQLAVLHGRPLHLTPSASSAQPSSERQTMLAQRDEAADVPSTCSSLPLLPQQPDLIQKLSSLEAQVATLHEHLAQLALALLQEREHKAECRLTVVETIAAELVGKPLSSSLPSSSEASLSELALPGAVLQALRLNPAEQRARSRLPALVERTASEAYVVISALEGELSFSPDSPQWFEWLATISSFRFVGKQGRFLAYREIRNRAPTRSWIAYRLIHQRQRRSWLGVTDRLTIAALERAAARLQTYVDAP